MSTKKKIILMPVYDGTITKNLLRTDFLKHVVAPDAVCVVLIPPKGKAELYQEEFSVPEKVIVETGPAWRHDRAEFIFSSIFKHSIPTEFMKIRQVDWYWNNGRYFSYAFTSCLRFMGKFRWWRQFLLAFNNLEPIPSEMRAIYRKWQPDLVFAPTMMTRDEVALMRLARRDGKRVVGMAKSFDNLTSKAFLRVPPDVLIVPNPAGVDEAHTLYDYPREKAIPTGICQYDVYAEKDRLIIDREQFIAGLGLDPQKRTILYAPAGDWMNPTDHETLALILQWIDEGRLPNTQVLLRLHPAYESKTETLDGHPQLLVERPGNHYGGLKTYEFGKSDVAHLANSLAHADVIVNTASTLMVEGSIFDTPVIVLGFDGKQTRPYWQSVVRYYDREHCLPIMKAGGVRLVTSGEALLASIREYFEYPEHDRDGRRRVAEAIAYKIDGKSCERTAKVVLDALFDK